jgi:hypothetical protein
MRSVEFRCADWKHYFGGANRGASRWYETILQGGITDLLIRMKGLKDNGVVVVISHPGA